MKQLLDKHKILTLVLAGVAGGVASLGGYMVVASNQATTIEEKQNASGQLARYASLNAVPAFDFTGVSEIANPAVVHIKSTISGGNAMGEGNRQQQMPVDPFVSRRPGHQIANAIDQPDQAKS